MVNKIKTEIVTRVNSRLNELNGDTLQIPLGTISGIQLFNGRGPKIKVRIFPVGVAEAEFRSEFLSAGVNQTLHRIMLSVDGSVTAISLRIYCKKRIKY